MKLSKLLFFAVVLCSTQSFAQTTGTPVYGLSQDAYRLAQEISQMAGYLNPQQAAQISSQLAGIRATLYNGNGQVMDQSLSCVSRDNDNAAPYVMGIRSGINVTRVSGTAFQSVQDCQTSIRSSRNEMGSMLACISRDSDGAAPWVIGGLNGTSVTKFARTVTGSQRECIDLLTRLNIRMGNAVYCTARDNDNAAPYVAANLDVRTGQTTAGTERFQSMVECNTFIGAR